MLDLRHTKNVSIIGGGTAGWFAALTLRRIFAAHVKVQLFESPQIGIIGVGEGGLVNLIDALNRLNIPTSEFMRATGAAYKWGFCYEGWRTGKKEDEYYHLFADPTAKPFSISKQGFYPLITKLIAEKVPLSAVTPAFQGIVNRVSQADAGKLLAQGDQGIASSYHFDSHKVATFLAQKAVERGVQHIQTKVQSLSFTDGKIDKIVTEHGEFETDFVIDASGFSRLIIGKTLKTNWRSFKDYLILDRAIPFHLEHMGQHPELVTRATAMRAGWMWQIPLQERIGAGYVFNSEFTTEQQAIQEIQEYLGREIQPQKTLQFEAGCFEQVWQKNIVALGLASGFVEPLEATSIGQMLEQLRMLENIILESGGVVSDFSIKNYNEANVASWEGIRDFLRMHYDCPRRDTPFWQKVSQLPYPESYQAIKDVFMQRSPRTQDITGYIQHGWHGIFHVVNWMYVAQGLGLISPEACQKEIEYLFKPQPQTN